MKSFFNFLKYLITNFFVIKPYCYNRSHNSNIDQCIDCKFLDTCVVNVKF
jgi:hypothetical protein